MTKLASDVGPNITGRVPGIRRMDSLKDHQGALYWSSEMTGRTNCDFSATVQADPMFNASRISGIYNGEILQPSALQLLSCIRI